MFPMIFSIVTHGDESLRRKAGAVGAVTQDIKTLAGDLLETMYAAEGVGLAANQVGREEAVCVVDVPPDAEKEECRAFNAGIAMPLAMVNPELLASSGTQRNNEGCLSFPDIHVQITRANEITFAFTTLEGERKTLSARGLLARAVLHEIDHLNGIPFIDRMTALTKLSIKGKLKRLLAQS